MLGLILGVPLLGGRYLEEGQARRARGDSWMESLLYTCIGMYIQQGC